MTHLGPYTVVGFYTPDYKYLWQNLEASLDRLAEPHHFMPVEKEPGGWEQNTLLKAHVLCQLADRLPKRTLLYLDVDTEVLEPLRPLLDEVQADLGLSLNARIRRNGAYKLHVISNVMLIRPTLGARAFLRSWAKHSVDANHGDVDQTALVSALGESYETTFQPLHPKWTGRAGYPSPAIVHANASRGERKVGSVSRAISNLFGERRTGKPL